MTFNKEAAVSHFENWVYDTYAMPYVETLLSHEAMLQPIPAPLRLQEVDEIANNSCQPNPANIPRFILKPLKDEIRNGVNRLSTVLSQLYRTGIPRYQQPATYPRDREIPYVVRPYSLYSY